MPHTQESVQNLSPHDAIYRADSKASKNCRDNCMVETTNVTDQVGSFPIERQMKTSSTQLSSDLKQRLTIYR